MKSVRKKKIVDCASKIWYYYDWWTTLQLLLCKRKPWTRIISENAIKPFVRQCDRPFTIFTSIVPVLYHIVVVRGAVVELYFRSYKCSILHWRPLHPSIHSCCINMLEWNIHFSSAVVSNRTGPAEWHPSQMAFGKYKAIIYCQLWNFVALCCPFKMRVSERTNEWETHTHTHERQRRQTGIT